MRLQGLTLHTYSKNSRPCPTVSQYQLVAPVTQGTRHLYPTQPPPPILPLSGDKFMMLFCFFLFIFPRKQDLTFHANCLHWIQFAWNAKSCFLWKIRKIFQNVVCWKFYPMCYLFVCVEILWPSQSNGVMSSVVSLPNHTFTGQA